MADTVDLLFFDTFAHENSEELNLDLVQFPKPVYVTEVRIIPLGARVQADFPGGVRLGATNPSQFSIEFFVNDLGKPGASTFESLGGFEYNQNGCINLECIPNDSIRKIPTDGLVLRGWYTTITLAVYGILTSNIAEQIAQPVPPSIPPPTALPEVQQILPVNAETEWNPEPIPTVPIEYSQQVAVPYAQSYTAPEQFPQEYSEYYNEVPKDPRSYHNTPESDWDNKSRGRSIERDRERPREERYQKTGSLEREHTRDRERYSRPHSQERERQRDYREASRERDYPERDRDRDRNYKHRTYSRDEREERDRKRPRTPPPSSPKRPHTPHVERKEFSPAAESFSEEEPNNEKARSRKNSPKETQASPVEDLVHMDVEEFEPILSDEDILDDSEHFQDLDYDYTAYTNNDDIVKLFVPGTTPLKRHKAKPLFELSEESLHIGEPLKTSISIIDDFFRSSITKYTLKDFEKLNDELKEEFIHLCEKITSTFGDPETLFDVIKLYGVVRTKSLTDSEELTKQIKSIVETLIEWLLIALDFNMANTQNQPPYKIRHIKCGVRLAGWSSKCIDFIRLLWERHFYIHKTLLDLYSQDYMALSIKLMILNALDSYLLHKEAIELFVRRTTDLKENGFDESLPSSEFNGYQTLIEVIRRNPSVRLKFALQSIFIKLNAYEVLYKLQDTVSKLRHAQRAPAESLSFIVNALDQIVDLYRGGPFVLSQPKRFLPVSAQFEINRSETENVLVKLFAMHNLIDCFTLLLSHEGTMNLSSIKTPIFELLSDLITTSEGLRFLTENCDCLNVLLKVLIQTDEAMQYFGEIKAHTLGLRMAYSVQCQFYVDALKEVVESHDDLEVIEQLHGLFCLTLHNIGKLICVRVLGFKENFRVLYRIIEGFNLREKEKTEAQLMRIKKSAGVAYVIDLICLVVVYDVNVSFIESHTKELLLLVKHQDLFDATVASKINEFASYVAPFENGNLFNYDNISALIDLITKHSEGVTNYPGQLITSLRILHHLGISKHSCKSPSLHENPLNNYTELKFKHVIIQLFSFDGVAVLTRILQKICEHYEQPHLHASTFVSLQGVGIVNVAQPCVDLLNQMLTYVIQCRNTNFKDLTSIPVLLQTYNLLRAFPNNSVCFFATQKLCTKIIDTLLVYTQPISEEVNEKDSLSRTLWTLMCGEVIKYINSSPYTFISGLLIFSELLPLPLPIQSQGGLSPEELSWAVNLRKLWSAHLHAYGSNIQELINRMCTSTHPPLLNLLRKVCIQLSDLAANSAVMIARGVLDTVHSGLIVEEQAAAQPCNSNTARLMNLLACLVTHNSLKCAVLNLLHVTFANGKGDEKYSMLIPAFGRILALPNSSTSHLQTQECILSVIQSLCDTEIALLQSGTCDKLEIYLANSLPNKETLLAFIAMMVEHLMAENSLVTYLPILRTLLLLTEHDYGFFHLREYIGRKPEAFSKILSKLLEAFSKDNEEYLSTITTLIEFLRVCLVIEEIADPNSLALRTMTMGPVEVRSLIGWTSDLEEQHPLSKLEALLKKTSEDDKNFESYIGESLSNIINLIKDSSEIKESYNEPILPAPSSLLVQFDGRPIFTLSDVVDEQLTASYWLSAPTDENSGDTENVTCDLGDVCRQHLPVEVNLIREVERLCRIYPSTNVEQDDVKVKGDVQKDKNKKTFVTPMARRGFARTIQVRTDLFRSRPPNTSRPPSLHVDDFVALETCGAQPTGPTGYNKISRELLATTRVTRGTRGRSFISAERSVQYRQMSWWGAGLSRGPYQ